MININFLKYSRMAGIYVGMAMILFANCSKQNNNTASGYWIIDNPNNLRYDINYTSRQDSLGFSVLKGNDNLASSVHPNVNTIYLWFSKTFPVKNGSYEMVNVHNLPYAMTDSQMGISGLFTSGQPIPCSSSDGALFDATGIASMDSWPWPHSGKAEVTVNNGKIKVNIPQTIAVYIDACGLDSPFLNLVYQEK